MDSTHLNIVYSFNTLENVPWIFPTAFLVNSDSHDRPAYIQAAATRETIASYLPEYNREVHDTLLVLCEELHPQEVEATLNKNKKKKEPLSSLFGDAQVSKTIQALIDRKMLKFLDFARMHNATLCLNLKRKIKACDILLYFGEDVLVPHLFFQKSQTGIQYAMNLAIPGEKIVPSEHNVMILTNHPSSLLVDNHIFKVDGINSAKVKPFLKNKSIFIPDRLSKDYFTGFIRDVLGKAEIEADGFHITKVSGLQDATLKFGHDFLNNRYYAEVIFDYSGATFSTTEQSKRKNRIQFGEDGEVHIVEFIRQEQEEAAYLVFLEELGVIKDGFGKFYYGSDPMSTLEWAGRNQAEITTKFGILFPEIEGKQIVPAEVDVRPEATLKGDWFDLHGIVSINGVEMTVQRLFPYIKQRNRFFPMGDNSWIVIPEEYFALYEPVLSFAVEKNGSWQLAKVHHPLLKSQGLAEHISSLQPTSNEQYEYTPSPVLNATLRPYQTDGVKWLIAHRMESLGACLADDMGLGKTLQTIAALVDAKEKLKTESNASSSNAVQLDLFGEIIVTGRTSLKALVIVPASLVTNWRQECKKYAPSLQVLVYMGPERKKAIKSLSSFDIIITTYQTAVADISLLTENVFNYLVLDESQTIRNKNSQSFKSLFQIQAQNKISLSGTPIENSLSDLWAQMEFINPSILGTYEFFKKKFQLPIEKDKNEIAIEQLKVLVGPYILRRTKEQVAKDLPPLLEEVRYTEMTEDQAKYFQKEKSAARNHLLGLDRQHGQYRFHVLSALMKLRQIANHPRLADANYTGDSGKFDEVREFMQTIIQAGHKVLVFSSFVSHLDLYADWLKKRNTPFVMLTGSMSTKERDLSVKSFQEDESIQVFLLSVKAGGTGLNLTSADYVIILDPWWNPFAEKQAIARAHRIGRTKNVFVTRFISTATIEEKILALQASKAQLSGDLIDVDELTGLTEEEINGLLDE